MNRHVQTRCNHSAGSSVRIYVVCTSYKYGQELTCCCVVCVYYVPRKLPVRSYIYMGCRRNRKRSEGLENPEPKYHWYGCAFTLPPYLHTVKQDFLGKKGANFSPLLMLLLYVVLSIYGSQTRLSREYWSAFAKKKSRLLLMLLLSFLLFLLLFLARFRTW